MNSSKHILSANHMRIVYNSLIQPYLTYGNLFWGNALRKYIHPLEIQQKKALRCLYKTNYNAHTTALFHEACVLKLRDVHNLQLCNLAYCFMHGKLPLPLLRMFRRHIDIHSLNTRQVMYIVLPKVKIDIVRKSFICECPINWNNLDNTTKCAPTFSSFKHKMKTRFISQYI